MGFLRPRKIDKTEIEARANAAPPAPEESHIAPLAEDFFKLERMRQVQAKPNGKLKG